MAEGDNKPQVITALSLDDLRPTELTARCQTIQGRTVLIKFTTLTWEEWDALGREVKDPDVKRYTTRLAENGIDLLPNPDDPKFKEAQQKAWDDRQARRLFASLEKSGFTIPGETALEKMRTLKKQGDSLLVNQLVSIVLTSQVQGRAEIEALADSFRDEPVPANDAPSDAETHPNGVGESIPG